MGRVTGVVSYLYSYIHYTVIFQFDIKVKNNIMMFRAKYYSIFNFIHYVNENSQIFKNKNNLHI